MERKLHNVTNYFLVSLAFADLLVSLVVMPCSIVQQMKGRYSSLSEMGVGWVPRGVGVEVLAVGKYTHVYSKYRATGIPRYFVSLSFTSNLSQKSLG